ncbi:MAG TPA: DNA-directed RNA polymerase subunit alpha C-terminal domain-containing protein [Chitinophagaceae bacterium]|nr:DNA-directed RNA polymerase subunit alpha C-terminal domain-containing protein [Chitinophagaceae bacterium]
MTKKKSIGTRKVCSQGHVFYKSSDCPVCPVCEKERNKDSGFGAFLGGPATRALENAGIKTLKQLSTKTEKEILKLHGMGPASIPLLRKKLKEKGFTFKK